MLASNTLLRLLSAFSLVAGMLMGGACAPDTRPEANAGALRPCAPPCAVARKVNGWCADEGRGFVAGVEVTSPILFEALDLPGHEMSAADSRCELCRAASPVDGFCSRHGIGFVDGRGYMSRLSYNLARTRYSVEPDGACPDCTSAAAQPVWCETHAVGSISGFRTQHRALFDELVKDLAFLEALNETALRCEWCAAAQLTGGRCPVDRTRYRDGRPIP